MRNILGMVLVLLIGITACDKKNDDKINLITELLKKDLQESEVQITNAISLIDDTLINSNELTNLIAISSIDITDKNALEEKVEIISELPIAIASTVSPETVPQIPQATKIQTSVEAIPSKKNIMVQDNLYVIQQESYIKVGDDKSYLTVSPRNSQKITVAVFPKNYSAMVDIYLYAIPTYSNLVRNDNTLIGYAKNLEFINQQAQFTRYWLAKKSDGRRFRRGAYNIYVEYHYKDNKGKVFNKIGRYWGGSHRNWIITVE